MSQRTCLAHATVVADTNFGTSSSAMFARKNGQETTTVDIFLIGYAWFRNVHYGTRRSVHEATNFRYFYLIPKLCQGKNPVTGNYYLIGNQALRKKNGR